MSHPAEPIDQTAPAEGLAPGALEGLRVVEMGQLIAGPFCGQLLGDMGADVVKIEPPGKGDPMRAWGQDGRALFWEVIGRNKRSVTLDLRQPEGQALARRLIAKADVLIENFRPGTLEGWGLAPETLQASHPGLIIARMSGYGQTGPYARRTGFGGIGEALGGWRYIVGDPDRPPSRMGVSIGDALAATYGCLGVLAALRHRSITGRGQVVDSSLYESVLQVMESLIPDYQHGGFIRERSGSILPGVAPSNVYPALDGEILIGANQDSLFARLAETMGQPALAQDPRFIDHGARGRHQAELDEIIAAFTRTKTTAELEALMEAASVPAGRMYRAPDMLADPHFQARESIVDVPHPTWGTVKMQNVTPKLSLTPGRVRRRAPLTPGEHNQDILIGELGLTQEALERLSANGVV